jgi:hypothetical protein
MERNGEYLLCMTYYGLGGPAIGRQVPNRAAQLTGSAAAWTDRFSANWVHQI